MFTCPLFQIKLRLLNPTVPDKLNGSGGQSKLNCLQNWANFHRSRAWQILLIFNVELYTFVDVAEILIFRLYFFRYFTIWLSQRLRPGCMKASLPCYPFLPFTNANLTNQYMALRQEVNSINASHKKIDVNTLSGWPTLCPPNSWGLRNE